MRKRYVVALIVESSTNYGRQLLRGILRFKKTQSDWSVFLEQRDLKAGPPSWLADWAGDGIICRSTTPEIAAVIRRRKIPFVELTDRRDEMLEFTTLRSDDGVIGRLGAEHLLERGFRNFGFNGFELEAWSDRRQAAFVQRLTREGLGCSVFKSDWYGTSQRNASAKALELEQGRLGDWIESLPKPVGIMACNDICGKQILDCCVLRGLAVPEKVAVVGVDNDEVLCNFCQPPLSSVVPNAELIGYRAAETLAHLMLGQPVKPLLRLVDPLDVKFRQSSDVVAIEDPDLANALNFIRSNACFGITVNDVLSHTTLSRSSLERRVRKLLGRSPQQEIRNSQLKQVRLLLNETDLSIEQIALQCGFEHPEYLHVMFKREYNMTPGEFRKASQK
jgi:LacI family transcriptional regulator